jgi:NADH:ubiquinone oxidoreductase subunit K
MPFWGSALLSGALFGLGLAGLLWPRASQVRLVCGLLMLNGALLLAVALTVEFAALAGQAVALLIVGVLAAEFVLANRALGKR